MSDACLRKRACDVLIICLVLHLSGAILNAQIVTFTDKDGYKWDLTTGGRVNDGQSNTFDSAPYLQINNSNFSSSGKKHPKNSRMMIYGPQTLNGFKVSRKVYIPKDFAGLIFLERVENTTANKLTLELKHYWNMGYTITNYENGKAHQHGLSTAAFSQSSSSASSTGFKLKSDKGELKVKLRYSSDDFYVSYDKVPLGPGKVATFMHAVVQRKNKSDALKAVEKLKLAKYAHVFDADDRKNLVNVSRQHEVYDLSPMALFRGNKRDLIELTTGETLSGEMAASDLKIQTDYGDFAFGSRQLISVVSMGYKRYMFVMKDGTCVIGRPMFKTLKWRFMDENLSEIELAYIRKLGTRSQNPDKLDQWFDFKTPVFCLRSGDRLVGTVKRQKWLLATDYGQMELPLSKIHRIDFPGPGRSVTTVKLIDQSVVSGVLVGDVALDLIGGNTVTVAGGHLRTIYFPIAQKEDVRDQPKLSLLREDLLYARLKKDAVIELNTPLGLRSIGSAQIRAITRGEQFGAGVNLIMWNNTSIPGRLKNSHLPFTYLEDLEINLPAGLIRNYQTPHAEPPAEVADKVKALIEALGDSKLAVRTEAEAELAAYGSTIKGLLLKFKESEDLELRLRVEEILKKIK